MARPRTLIVAVLALAVLGVASRPASADEISQCAAATYQPARQPPFGGEPVPPLEPVHNLDRRPAGFDLTPRQAIRIADGTDAVEDGLADDSGADIRVYTQGHCRWQVSYFADGKEKARVAIDDRTGTVLEAFSGHQVGSELARGYEDAIAQKVNAPYIWLPLCLLFLAPFVDLRRPLRLLHLDLLAILALGVSLYFFNRAEITASVLLTYPVLVYVFARMLWAGVVPRQRPGPLVPRARVRWLAMGAIVLALARIAVNVGDSRVIDIGVAGVVGADRIEHGEPLYEGHFSPGLDLRGDVYGPANYLAYVPFELVFPWDGAWDSVPAAHAAAIAFDLLTALGLVLLGRRLRRGREGTGLGVGLAFAWLACPFTLYTMNANANDSLVAALIVAAMLALGSAPVRGAFVALASAAKFGSAALAPLFATASGERRVRSVALFTLALVIVAAVVVVPFIPDGGLREMYDRTLGYQATRNSPFSIWGLAPSLDFLRSLTRAGAVILAVAVAFWPSRKTPVQIAALAAAVTIAVQVGATHWFYFYVVWFLPLYLVAIFAAQRRVTPATAPGFIRSSSAAPRAAAR
jgi:hypothetical protein